MVEKHQCACGPRTPSGHKKADSGKPQKSASAQANKETAAKTDENDVDKSKEGDADKPNAKGKAKEQAKSQTKSGKVRSSKDAKVVLRKSHLTGCKYNLLVKHLSARPGFCMVISPEAGHTGHSAVTCFSPYLTRQAKDTVRAMFKFNPDIAAVPIRQAVTRDVLVRGGLSADHLMSDDGWMDFGTRFPDLYRDANIRLDEIE